jgi:hypothetical protein
MVPAASCELTEVSSGAARWLMSHCLFGSLLAEALGVAVADGSRLWVGDGVGTLLGVAEADGVAEGVAEAAGVAALRTTAEFADGTAPGVPEGDTDGVGVEAGAERPPRIPPRRPPRRPPDEEPPLFEGLGEGEGVPPPPVPVPPPVPPVPPEVPVPPVVVPPVALPPLPPVVVPPVPPPLRGLGTDELPPVTDLAAVPAAFDAVALGVLDAVAPVFVPGAPLVQVAPAVSGAEAGTAFGAIFGPASAAKASFGASVPINRAVGMAVRAMARPTGRWMRPRTVGRGAA